MGSIVQLPNHTKFFYCRIWSTSSKDAKILAWVTRGKKYKNFPLILTDQSFIWKSMRGSEPSAELRDESLQDDTAVEGCGECCWQQLDPSGGLGRGGAGWSWALSFSPPSQSLL